VPAGRVIKAIVDNDATYKHPNVRAWLTRQRIMHSEGLHMDRLRRLHPCTELARPPVASG
jgi:hypothetical protein